MYLIKEVSDISGVSVRTLRHYDEIGLLSPQKQGNGYRCYSEEDMSALQTILFYRYLGFPLKQIKELLTQEESEISAHLKRQLALMQEEKQRILTLISTLEKTIESRKRRTTMQVEEKFAGFTYRDGQKYRQAAIDMYGKEAVERSDERQKGKEQALIGGFNEIFSAFSANMSEGLSPASDENTALAERLHEHICRYSFDCSMEAFLSIGRGYAENEEFRKNLDKFGPGTAQYACDAISRYASEKGGRQQSGV